MWLSNLKQGFKKGFINRDKGFIRRWPKDPKVVFFAPPNVFAEELTQRYVGIVCKAIQHVNSMNLDSL